MNKLHINARYCKGCLICVEVCPKRAIRSCGAINARGYVLPEEDDMRRCTACGLCEAVCPDFAIAIEEIVAVGVLIDNSAADSQKHCLRRDPFL